MSAKSDEEIVRNRILNPDFDHVEMNDAAAALERLMQRVMPELPDGYFVYRVVQPRSLWVVEIGKRTGLNTEGEGPTLRAACEAAIAKIGGASGQAE